MRSEPRDSEGSEPGFRRGLVFLLIALLAGVLNLGLLDAISTNRAIISALERELAADPATGAATVHEQPPAFAVPVPAIATCHEHAADQIPACDPLRTATLRPSV